MSLAIGVALLSLAGVGAAGASPEAKPVTVVATGEVIDRATVSGQVDRYALDLEAGQFVHAVVDQRNVADVLVSVEDPRGQVGMPFEGPSSTVSPVAFVASDGGRHVLVAAHALGQRGRPLRVADRGRARADPSDLLLVRTARAMSEAGRVFGTGEAHARGMALWQESLDGWRALGNRTHGDVDRDPDREPPPDAFRGVSRSRGRRSCAASRSHASWATSAGRRTSLFNLGSSSWRLAEFDAARKYFEEDLALHRAAGRIAERGLPADGAGPHAHGRGRAAAGPRPAA